MFNYKNGTKFLESFFLESLHNLQFFAYTIYYNFKMLSLSNSACINELIKKLYFLNFTVPYNEQTWTQDLQN